MTILGTTEGLDQILELSPDADDASVREDQGISQVAREDRRLHSPDICLLGVRGGSVVARCSCWWRRDEPRLGVIGHYASTDSAAGTSLLARACAQLAKAGCSTAVGPMDGNTWRRYRFITERGTEPSFFLEPDNPDDWPRQWARAGFSPCVTYTSALNEDLSVSDPRASALMTRLALDGVAVRPLDPRNVDEELRRIFELSCVAFQQNPFYAPIEQAEFRSQIQPLLPVIRPELVLLAERRDTLAGFIFAVPDHCRPADTVILKTLAVHPSLSGMGLGSALMDAVQQNARGFGFRRAVHALMHETNVSRRISAHYAHTIRRYALFSRSLT